MAGAVQVVLQTDVSTSRNFVPLAVDSNSGAYLSSAKDILRTTITQRNNRLYVDAVLTGNSTQKDSRYISVSGAASAGVLPLLNAVAKRLDSDASVFSTKNDRALQSYVKAATSTIPQTRVDALTDAISIDPSFGLAYIGLLEVDAQTAPQSIPALLQLGASRRSTFTRYDRARFDSFLARYSHAPIPQQEAALRTVLQIAPNESDALVGLGSLSGLSGDAGAATRYFERALALNPGNANVQRSFAQALFQTRHFHEAERLLVGMDNNAAVLPELAICVLMEGDVARANVIAERLFPSISNPDAKILYHAVWLKLSGQSQQAADLLISAHFAQPGAQAIGYSELSMWHMMANDFAGAKQLAAKAQQIDPRPGSFGSLVALLASANEPAAIWKQQVDSSFISANERLKQNLLGYGFFLGGHDAEAAETWNRILQQSGGGDLHARAMLAASFMSLGKADQARQLNVEPFVPDFGDLYASVSFFELNRALGVSVR